MYVSSELTRDVSVFSVCSHAVLSTAAWSRCGTHRTLHVTGRTPAKQDRTKARHNRVRCIFVEERLEVLLQGFFMILCLVPSKTSVRDM